MNAEDKRLLKSVVKKVHPDLFNDLEKEREHNSQSLKVLNTYLADVGRRENSKSVTLSFWVKQKSLKELVLIKTELPAWGSIGPLLYAFDLITETQLLEGAGNCSGKTARNVLSWLESSVEKAASAAEEHESLRSEIRALKANLEDDFCLSSVKLSGEFSISTKQQKRHVEALKALRDCLHSVDADRAQLLRGLQIQLHHALSASTDSSPENGLRACPDTDYIGEDGTLHIIAEIASMPKALAELDLFQARLLTQVAGFWQRRSRDLMKALKFVLGVQKIWCDSYTDKANQQFVEWAAKLIDKRASSGKQFVDYSHDFSLLLHTDTTAPAIDFTPASSMLQVRCDTSPEDLLEYLDTTARTGSMTAAQERNKEEDTILETLKQEMGLKHVIRVCASSEQDKVVDAAKRLLQHQKQFKAAGIKLEDCPSLKRSSAGASLAFDNCYEVWESGFISIPYDFQLQDLQPKLQLLLPSSMEPIGDPSQLLNRSTAQPAVPTANLHARASISGNGAVDAHLTNRALEAHIDATRNKANLARESESRRPSESDSRRPSESESRTPSESDSRRPLESESRRPSESDSRRPLESESKRPTQHKPLQQSSMPLVNKIKQKKKLRKKLAKSKTKSGARGKRVRSAQSLDTKSQTPQLDYPGIQIAKKRMDLNVQACSVSCMQYRSRQLHRPTPHSLCFRFGRCASLQCRQISNMCFRP